MQELHQLQLEREADNRSASDAFALGHARAQTIHAPRSGPVGFGSGSQHASGALPPALDVPQSQTSSAGIAAGGDQLPPPPGHSSSALLASPRAGSKTSKTGDVSSPLAGAASNQY
jgi:hypothetical protein